MVSLVFLPLPAGSVSRAMCSSVSSKNTSSTTRKNCLTCDTIEGTGLNLIFHSSSDVRCTFKDDAGSEQWYMGETGMAIGLDLKWNKEQTIYLGVLSSTQEFAPEGDFLTGGYGGVKAEASVGAGVGVSLTVTSYSRAQSRHVTAKR